MNLDIVAACSSGILCYGDDCPPFVIDINIIILILIPEKIIFFCIASIILVSVAIFFAQIYGKKRVITSCN